MDKRYCIACNSELVPFAPNILYCKSNCGMGITYPIPKPDYHSYHRDDQYSENSRLFDNIFSKRVKLITQLIHSGKALEIGSSNGRLLHQLKNQGWQVQGLDPSHKAAQEAISSGIPTIVSNFETAKISPNKFDVVILNHTLEHLENISSVLKKIHLILKPSGLIFIDVPNFFSLSARLLRSRWPYLLVSEHNWHFTPKSLSILLSSSKFKVVHIESRSGVWDYGNPLLELWHSLSGFKKRFFLDFLSVIPSFIMTKLNLGTSLTVIAKKI